MRIRGNGLDPVCPAGWFFKTSVTLVAPDGQGNVIASSEPIDVRLDTEQYFAEQGVLLYREFPKFAEEAQGRLSLEIGRAHV